LKLAKNIRFELDANGNIAPKSLNIDGANIAQVIMEQIDESPANCEICQAQQGAKYGFYYGKVLSSSSYTTSSGAMSTTTTTTSFDIGGRKTVAVCDSCRQKYYWKSLGKALVIAVLCSIPLTYFLTVAMWISGSQEGFGAVLSILSIPFLSGPLALAGLIPLLEGVLGEGSKGAGEKAARDLKQPDLKAQGYDKFWTSKQYEKLKTSGRNF
jgi:hypothetical protein